MIASMNFCMKKTHIVEQLGAVQTPAKGELNVAISSFNYPKEESPALEQIKFAIQKEKH